MACEYQESDVVFSDHAGQGRTSSYHNWPPHPRKNSADRMGSNDKKLRGSNRISSDSVTPSSPICVPKSDHFRWEGKGWERGGGEEVVVPPHLMVAAGRAEFSVCSGRGRTLKGRDLKEVRDEILRMTGFLEA